MITGSQCEVGNSTRKTGICGKKTCIQVLNLPFKCYVILSAVSFFIKRACIHTNLCPSIVMGHTSDFQAPLLIGAVTALHEAPRDKKEKKKEWASFI